MMSSTLASATSMSTSLIANSNDVDYGEDIFSSPLSPLTSSFLSHDDESLSSRRSRQSESQSNRIAVRDPDAPQIGSLNEVDESSAVPNPVAEGNLGGEPMAHQAIDGVAETGPTANAQNNASSSLSHANRYRQQQFDRQCFEESVRRISTAKPYVFKNISLQPPTRSATIAPMFQHDLVLCTWNMRGYTPHKWLLLHRWLVERNVAFIAIQETHLLSTDADALSSTSRFLSIRCDSDTRHTRGVAQPQPTGSRRQHADLYRRRRRRPHTDRRCRM